MCSSGFEPGFWVGYLEHGSENMLGAFDRNVGMGNYTIFGATTGLQGLPWCATFVHAVIGRRDLLGRPHPGVQVLRRRMRRKGFWQERGYIPVKGDLIFLETGRRGKADHCGIVEIIQNGSVISVDGNTIDPGGRLPKEYGGAVARRTRALNDPRILGYGAIGRYLR